ncbi:hypothetical protein [Streptomyces sp. NPDC046925]|uniref:hypothetical protein n=1 Tax=Streptomyces sp. NPDC046925 TaxID=3155375 RepID=UPI0033F8A034
MRTGAEDENQAWASEMVSGLPPMDCGDIEDLESIRDLVAGEPPVTRWTESA